MYGQRVEIAVELCAFNARTAQEMAAIYIIHLFKLQLNDSVQTLSAKQELTAQTETHNAAYPKITAFDRFSFLLYYVDNNALKDEKKKLKKK